MELGQAFLQTLRAAMSETPQETGFNLAKVM